jgi:2,4-dienoyl-CoA reductase-like NADH-dependent reductase (Old Yellow Enzyme family)
MIKLNSEDFLEGGLSVDEMVEVAARLETAGIDAIELSGGTAYSGKCTPSHQSLEVWGPCWESGVVPRSISRSDDVFALLLF